MATKKTEAAKAPTRDELIAQKMKAGLTRAQAEQVLAAQAEFDKQSKPAPADKPAS